MTSAAWRLTLLALALVLAICTGFHVSPSSLGRYHLRPRDSVLRRSATQSQQVALSARDAAGASRTTYRGPSMAGEPRSSKGAQRVAVVAAGTSVATLAGAALPAHAQDFAEFLTNGLVGAINGPGILAIPIVAGFGLASAIAYFIYFFSQPREYDE